MPHSAAFYLGLYDHFLAPTRFGLPSNGDPSSGWVVFKVDDNIVCSFSVKRFNTDLTPRKSDIKLMIQDELTKLADEADDDEEEGDPVTDDKQQSGPAVKA